LKKNDLDIFDPLPAGMFTVVNEIAQNFKVDYFLIGAVAKDIQLSSRPGLAAKRKTNDIDIAIVIDNEDQFDKIIAALIATGDFRQTENNPIKLMYQERIELDLLPFGEIENQERQLRLNKGVVSMDMNGFKEVYPFVETHAITKYMRLKVCPFEGLVLLKLIANADNSTRTKDIADIEQLIKAYFELTDEDIYTKHMDVMDMYPISAKNYLELVSARVLGRKMKMLLENTPGGIDNLERILSRRPSELWQAMLDGLRD
jgi:predicted nucleotidyltransferase